MSTTIIESHTLNDRLGTGNGIQIVDVRLEDDFQAEHLPDAINNCVFEVTFLDRMAEAAPDKSMPVCVYGHSDVSHESRMAAAKLDRAGYTLALELREGLAGWKEAGLPTVARPTNPPRAPGVPDGRFELDLEESRVEWLGRNLMNKHEGTVPLKAGYLEFRGSLPVSGEMVLDMTGLKCTDLAGDKLHDVLIGHLESDDFFDVELYPEARFVIRSSEAIAGAGPGERNLRIQGELSLKDVTRPVEIIASAGVNGDGLPAAQASLSIDRTEWGVIYGSGKFFQRLAGHLVNDEIQLQLRMIARRA